MASVKSLQKLRSASIHFLEDGGSLLNGVDGLLRELQRFLCEIEAREEAVLSQEHALKSREAQLKQLEVQLLEWIEASKPQPPPPTQTTESETRLLHSGEIGELATPCDQQPPVADEDQVQQVQADVSAIQQVVAESVQPTPQAERKPEMHRGPKPLPSMMAAAKHRRKKRYR